LGTIYLTGILKWKGETQYNLLDRNCSLKEAPQAVAMEAELEYNSHVKAFREEEYPMLKGGYLS
jgi:hypothetical protein